MGQKPKPDKTIDAENIVLKLEETGEKIAVANVDITVEEREKSNVPVDELPDDGGVEINTH